MEKYPKINSIYKRDEKGNFLIGEWSSPELEYLQDSIWEWTEKVDGTNIRVIWDGEKVTFGGKTDNAQIPASLYKVLQDLFPKEKFNDLPPLCLYGEGYGKKIQKGGGNYNPNGVSFVLFDVKIDTWWLYYKDICDIARQLQIEVVPLINYGTIGEAIKVVQNGFDSRWGNFTAEGLVLRPATQLFGRKGERIITKVKHKDFI